MQTTLTSQPPARVYDLKALLEIVQDGNRSSAVERKVAGEQVLEALRDVRGAKHHRLTYGSHQPWLDLHWAWLQALLAVASHVPELEDRARELLKTHGHECELNSMSVSA